MVQVVINPQTGEPISKMTLVRYFRQELDAGHTKADTMVAQSLYKNATTPTKTFPGGIPLAQIFWLKTRARWKPPTEEVQAPDPGLTPEQQDEREVARRIAFVLARGAASSPPAKPKPKKKVPQPA